MKKIVVLIAFIAMSVTSLNADNLAQAKTLIQAKNYQQSLSVLQSINREQPENIEALYYLALNHYLVGEHELMIKHGVRAYTKDHELAKEVRQYANDQKFGEQAKIGFLRKIRLAKQIRNELYLVLQDEPDNANAHYALAYYYILTPYILSGSVKKSFYHIQELQKSDEQRAYKLYNDYYKKVNHSDKHISNLKTWNKEYPDDWDAVFELARYEQDQKNVKKAYALLKNWLEKKPNDAKAIYQVGRLAATTGDYLQEGEMSLKHYLTLPTVDENPEPKWAHYRLAMIYQHMKSDELAEAHITKALSIEPKNKEFRALKAKL